MTRQSKFGDQRIVARSLTGFEMANVAANSTLGGVPIVIPVTVTGGSTANYDVTVVNKIRVLDAWFYATAAGTTSDTIQLKNGTSAMSDAVDIATALDHSITRIATLDNAQYEVAAGGTLRVAQVDGGGSDTPSGIMYVLAMNVA